MGAVTLLLGGLIYLAGACLLAWVVGQAIRHADAHDDACPCRTPLDPDY